jgi:hypothetical protein
MGADDPYDLKGLLKRLGGTIGIRFSSIKPFTHSGSTALMERHESAAIVQSLPD